MPRELDTLSPSQPEHVKCCCYPCLAPLSPSPTAGSRGTCHFQVDPTRQLRLPSPAPRWETARRSSIAHGQSSIAQRLDVARTTGSARPSRPARAEQLLPMRAPQRVSHHLGLPLRALARPRRSCCSHVRRRGRGGATRARAGEAAAEFLAPRRRGQGRAAARAPPPRLPHAVLLRAPSDRPPRDHASSANCCVLLHPPSSCPRDRKVATVGNRPRAGRRS